LKKAGTALANADEPEPNRLLTSFGNRSLAVAARLVFACLPLLPLQLSGITLKTSDARLAAAFEWARSQALAYAFTGDPVGDWYEAALPGRQAFCMRDTAHQCLGAHMLGLAGSTHNMLRKFAENISESKDWCSYWEINRENLPAPIDYLDDAHFWYNLPANFDVLDACYRMYIWTGDRSYLTDPVFLNFYRRTVHEYVDRWDLGLAHIMTRPRIMNVRGRPDAADHFQKNRGIPSYDEGDPNFAVSIDQLAAQYAGYLAYARIERLKGNSGEAEEFLARARDVKASVNGEWWDNDGHNYHTRVNLDHRLGGSGLNLALLYYGVAEDGAKAGAVLNGLLKTIGDGKAIGIEGQSHFPEVLYREGKAEAAYDQILDLTHTGKNRREYPEVSYAVIGAIATGLMGLELNAAEPEKGTVQTLPRLSAATQWAEIDHVPVRANEVNIRHDGVVKTTFVNSKGPSLVWRACFPGSFPALLVDGKSITATHAAAVSCTTVDIGSGDTRTVQVPK
jgi:hypothetical protein